MFSFNQYWKATDKEEALDFILGRGEGSVASSRPDAI